jgi:hypothetical protein
MNDWPPRRQDAKKPKIGWRPHRLDVVGYRRHSLNNKRAFALLGVVASWRPIVFFHTPGR